MLRSTNGDRLHLAFREAPGIAHVEVLTVLQKILTAVERIASSVAASDATETLDPPTLALAIAMRQDRPNFARLAELVTAALAASGSDRTVNRFQIARNKEFQKVRDYYAPGAALKRGFVDGSDVDALED